MQGEVQQFASAPQAVGARGTRQKYRDPNEDTLDKNNIMHDRRVVRGNTYASLVMPQNDMAEVQKQREAQRRRLMRANQTKRRPGTPEPVPGRKHMDIQTDSYLEELTERTVEFEAETQTDFPVDRPPSPLFCPAQIGKNVGTQIEDGELFDFDREVEPVLEVLVGKTLEQAMMEVLEEEELDSLRRHQEDFEKQRNAELLEVQRMEAAEKRRSDELSRRMNQQGAQREQDLSMMRKVVSRSIAAHHLSSLRDRALAHLQDAGVFTDSVQDSVDSRFLPQLLQAVSKHVEQTRRDRMLVNDVMASAVAQRLELHSQALDRERERLNAIDEAEKRVRLERRNETAMKAQEEQRIAEEQDSMKVWEHTQPPEEPPEEGHVVKFEEGLATLADDRTASVSEDLIETLTGMLAGVEEGKRVMGRIVKGEEGMISLTDLRVADPALTEEEAAAAAAVETA